MSIILQWQFKSLLRGEMTKNEIWQHSRPDIQINIDDKRITIKGDFNISEDLIFYSTDIFNKEIFFDGGNYKNIIFRGGKFTKVIFRRGIYNGFVSIRGGEFQNLLLLGGNFNHWLGTIDGINNSEDGDKTKLADEKLIIKRFEIEGGTYANNMWISGGEIDSLEIKCVTPVKIHCKPNDDKIFDPNKDVYEDRFTSVPKIRNLIISRYSNKDNFYHFSSLELGKIEFENFTNIGNITISKIKLNECLSIQNSDLGKTTFIDCNFSNQKMYFDSSKINEIALAGSSLPDPIRILSRFDNSTQKKLALSQTKKVYQNMGDSLSAGQYQAQELDTYMRTLSFGWEKVNLLLNSKSNNHGQNWGQALKVLVFGGLCFFVLYCLALGFRLDASKEGILTLLKNAAYLIEFINPIRKSDFLPKALIGIKEESSIPTMVIVIDSIAKLFNAYMIYQLISAFRKHSKKSE